MKSTLLVLLAGTTFYSPLYAQEPATDETSTLLETIVITAGGYEQDIKHAPASISIVSEDQLKKKAIADISEAIRTVPGVNVGFGSDGTRGISMRGLGTGYTLILIDGKRVNASATTLRHYNGDLDWVPIEAIERIEVVRGPMSTLYGSDALGGVVNIITKKGSDRWTGSLTTEFLLPDSDATGQTRRLNGYISGPIIPDTLNFTAFGNISKKDSDDSAASGDISVPDGNDNFDLTGRLTFTPSADQTFDLEIGHGRERYKPYLADGETDTSKTEIERTTASLRHVGEWDIGTSTTTGFFEQATNNNRVSSEEITSRNYTFDSKLALTPFDYFWTHNVIVGGELRYEELDDPVNLGQENSLTGSSGKAEASVFTGALFAEDEIEFTDAFRMTAGLRYDYNEHFGSHFSPRTYFTYDLTDALTFKTGWAQAFKAPNLRQLDPNWVTSSRGRGCGAVGGPCEMVGNPDLEPETSNSFEAGFYYDNGAWQASATYFFNDVKNKITSARVASLILDDGTKYVQQINVDRARSQGIEGSLTIPIHPDLTWTNAFTYLLESKNLETGMPLSADPEYAIHTEMTWQARENLSFTASLDWYGKQVDYVEVTETLTAQNVKPYSSVNLSTKYDINDNFTMKAGVNNVFDSQPESSSNYKENGRAYFISLTSKF
ncbi:TonB-dependent receptor domain-containing protein [Agrobacterium sp. OT33]|uniref:TonB-dependent receptor domain-containing protein n=1 Tax=Agrobacterium sp. OT33 TaxID=2815338 RepID=UPI0027381CDE|nr:TonB-dependent receptor [Agrobacterium sp. OT33]